MVCTDAMHKLVDRIPFYELLIEDGNVRSEITALGLLVNERQETLESKNEDISIENLSNMPSPNLICEDIDQLEECYIENDQAGKITLDSDISSTSLVCEEIHQSDEYQFNVGAVYQSTSDKVDIVQIQTENNKIAIKDIILTTKIKCF
ncbi:hypothetical protein QTP88_027056 [Uroleucon formosanum]